MNFSFKFFIIVSINLAITLFVLIHDPMFDMNQASWRMLGLLFVMSLFWVTEIMPLGITALIPIVYAPLAGIESLKNVTSNFGNPIIFLFLGGFMLGIAMEKWELHKRISLNLLNKVGPHPKKQLITFMAISAVFSMWISNAATVVIVLPVALAIINNHYKDNTNFSKALLIGIAYSASIGGMGTLIGTPPNILLRGFLEANFNIKISFVDWMILAMPLVLVFLVAIYFVLTKVFSIKNVNTVSSDNYDFKDDIAKLGKMKLGEKLVSTAFILTAICWVFRELINKILNIDLTDEIIAVIALLCLFLIPVSLKEKKFLMDFEHLKKVPWDILLLFGGGLALSGLFIKSGLDTWIAEHLGLIQALSLLIIIFIIVLIIVASTEFTSNTAMSATFLPIIGALAIKLGFNPLLLTIPLVMGASCAFMLPVGTPPNAIIFGSGKIKIIDLVKSGICLNILSIILISVYAYFVIPLIFKL